MPPSTPSHAPANRLAQQASPYLRQHMHNPVDWFPWGQEALSEARRRGVPIFLSVGYSTCYWCHVMERECFENPEIATLMNRHFVCIKVDREERPDIDDIYMAGVQLFSQGHGGWPMSVWLTPPGARGETDPGLEPFYAGTYFPPTHDPRYGRPSFPQLLASIAQHWVESRPQILEQAARATDAIRDQLDTSAAPVALQMGHIGACVSTLLRIYDQNDAGFGNAPKFPQPVFLEFLLDAQPAIEDPAIAALAQRALRHTLDRMALGGLNDQIGGGFHRYSTDAKWLVPHFEKMLYDNAQLASVYARSYRTARDEFDARTLRETLDYVLREMTDPATGAFFSAQDAEVNHREGQNYLWTREQLRKLLTPDDAALAERLYGIDQGTNFRDPHHPEDGSFNVLFMPRRPEDIASSMGMTLDHLLERRAAINTQLLRARAQRDQPGTDDKVIAAWNGLMLSALADASVALGDTDYLDAAERAATAIMVNMHNPRDGLRRVMHAGKSQIPAFLEDHAALAGGLVAIARARLQLGRPGGTHLSDAIALLRTAIDTFGDRHTLITQDANAIPYTLLYEARKGQTDLIVRHRGFHDGAMPSGASLLLHALLDLHDLTGETVFLDDVRRILIGLSSAINESPVSAINSVRALHRLAMIDPTIFDAVPVEHTPEHTHSHAPQDPVRVFASVDRVGVPSSGNAVVRLRLEIDPGYHITAANPVPPGTPRSSAHDSLVPLSVRIEGGEGVNAVAKYPTAALHHRAEPPIMAHEGTIEFDIELARTGAKWSGRPLLVMTYQACTDAACLAPTTIELDVAIDPA